MKLVNGIGLAATGLTLALGCTAIRADIVAVVSSKNPTTTLSRNQVMDIFLGRRTRFPDGNSAMAIDQTEGSVARDKFYSTYAEMSPAQVKAFWSKIIFTGRGKPPKAVANDVEAKKLVVENLNAIAYIDQALVDSSVKVVLAP